MVDAVDSKSTDSNIVRVRVSLPAPRSLLSRFAPPRCYRARLLRLIPTLAALAGVISRRLCGRVAGLAEKRGHSPRHNEDQHSDHDIFHGLVPLYPGV